MTDIGDAEACAALSDVIAGVAAESGTLHRIGEDGMLHLMAAVPPLPEPVLAAVRVIPVGKGMAGLAVERGQPVDACNIQTDDSGDVQAGAKATGLQGAIVVPVFAGATIVGALGVANRAARTFTQAEVDRLLDDGRRLAERFSLDDLDSFSIESTHLTRSP